MHTNQKALFNEHRIKYNQVTFQSMIKTMHFGITSVIEEYLHLQNMGVGTGGGEGGGA